MNASKTRRAALCALTASLLATAAIAPASKAGTTPVDVRVATDTGRQLVDVRQYTDTAAVPTSPQAKCFGSPGGSGKPVTVFGATGLGAVADAAKSVPALNPILVTDQFSFGPGVCGFGGISAAADYSNYWQLRVDHKYAQLGGGTQISKGDDVLWVLQPATFDMLGNPVTDPELSLQIPARTRPGVPLLATVYEYTAQGALRPSTGAVVTGATAPTDGNGKTEVTLTTTTRVVATRSGALPSRALPVCVRAKLKRCGRKRGLPIFGSDSADVIGGTIGSDSIKALGGNDRISVRGRGVDRVQCGAGVDRVKADRRDKIDKASCEKVRRPKAKRKRKGR